MNLSRAYPLFILLCIAGGATIAHFTGASIFIGTAIGSAVGVAPMALLCITYLLFMKWRPDRPMCRCGKCRSEEYEYIGPKHITAETVFEYRCPFCGRIYRQKEKRFWEFLDNGSDIPYMSISKWGRWQMESAEPTLAADAEKPRR